MMFIFSKFKLWFLSEKEKRLFQKKPIIKKGTKKLFSLVQCVQDEDYYNGFKEIIENESNSTFGGISPKLGYASFVSFILIVPNIIYKTHLFMIRKKWKKIYSRLEIDLFFHPSILSYNKKVKNFFSALKYFRKIKSKESLLEHSFNEILCGDLIYDSYIRFNKKPTLNLLDPSLILYIFDCYNHISYFESIVEKYNVSNYYSSYSTYIAHGVPVRVFLKYNINVYTISYINEPSYNFKIKKLNKRDTTQGKPHWKYKEIFNSLDNKNQHRKEGLEIFKKRFSGISDLDFMRVNQYDPSYSSPKFESKFDGVFFIGDFFDSQHIFRKMLFNDLYECLIYTIKLSLKYNLNIGFKPHPNQLLGSKKIIDKIKKEYPNINWINSKTSNKLIFNSGISYGISVWGSALPELALHKIIPICCADNPASDYNFLFEAQTIQEFKEIILNPKKFKFKKNLMQELGEWYYMQNLYKGFNFIK